MDTGGWDNHVNERRRAGPAGSNLLRDFMGQGLAALHQDLGDHMEDVVVVTVNDLEFGRTAHENGNRGTDHGHANCMFVMGGPVERRKSVRQVAGIAAGAVE